MSTEKEQTGAYVSPAQIGIDNANTVKRWLLELDLSEKEEKEWLKTGRSIYSRYRGTKQKKNSFNILWSNTETLRQAVYNTLPKPDVRRRFRDADPVAKVVSTTIERCADYAMDVYDFDHVLKLDLLDMLLPGRGVSRVKYEPDIEDVIAPDAQPTTDAQPQTMQRIKYERVTCEHVQYDDFRRGPGKTWDEVRWVAFRHKFSQAGGIDKFGDIFGSVPLEEAAGDEFKKCGNEVADLFKTAEVWEIWNKDDSEVLFIAPAYKDAPLQKSADPLNLDGFFPSPRPLYAIEDAESLVPTPLYELYKQQAEELDRVSSRINNLTDSLKVRGVYNAVLREIDKLKDASDNQLLAAENAQALSDSGGLEKHIWYMPIEQAANVINILIQQRESTKAVIYEITGIADIMRGATDPNETKGAQLIKTQWGTQRLKKMQAEFQRYVRDIIRLKSQIICAKFQPQTIKEMTGIKLLDTEAEKQKIAAQAQAFQQFQQQQSQQQNQSAPAGFFMPPQPPSPEQMELLNKPSWEQVIGLMRDNVHRNYRIDIETDSTIAASMESDMQGLQQVLTGLANFIAGAAPAVQSGSLPIEAVKEIAMTITRRARMGLAVEDALDKMQEPQPQADPQAQIEQAKLQAQQQQEQMKAALEREKMQAQAQLEAQKIEAEMRAEEHKQEMQAREVAHQNQLEAERDRLKAEQEAALEQMRIASEQRIADAQRQLDWEKAQLDAQTKIVVADMAAKTSIKQSAMTINASSDAETPMELSDEGEKVPRKNLSELIDTVTAKMEETMRLNEEGIAAMSTMMQEQYQKHVDLVDGASKKPKVFQRGPDGKITHVDGRPVVRDENGRAVGIE